MAQSESESISGNVKWGVRKRMKNGTYKVRFDLLGYSVDKDGNPYIVPAEAEAVRTIFKMFLDGASLLQLQQYLEGNGFKTPRGNSVWQRSVISYMLKNEKYVGDVLYQKTYRRDCISKKVLRNNGELTRYLISNNHPAIIDRETFNLVQLEIARRSNKRKKSDKGLTELGKYSGKYALTDLHFRIYHIANCSGSIERPLPCRTSFLKGIEGLPNAVSSLQFQKNPDRRLFHDRFG